MYYEQDLTSVYKGKLHDAMNGIEIITHEEKKNSFVEYIKQNLFKIIGIIALSGFLLVKFYKT